MRPSAAMARSSSASSGSQPGGRRRRAVVLRGARPPDPRWAAAARGSRASPFDLGSGEALPLAGVALAQVRVEDDGPDAELARDDRAVSAARCRSDATIASTDAERPAACRACGGRGRSAAGPPGPATGRRRSTPTGRGGRAAPWSWRGTYRAVRWRPPAAGRRRYARRGWPCCASSPVPARRRHRPGRRPGATVGDVLAAACARYGEPFAAVIDHCQIWRNGEPSEPPDAVSDADEVAVLPPVSGGAADGRGGHRVRRGARGSPSRPDVERGTAARVAGARLTVHRNDGAAATPSSTTSTAPGSGSASLVRRRRVGCLVAGPLTTAVVYGAPAAIAAAQTARCWRKRRPRPTMLVAAGRRGAHGLPARASAPAARASACWPGSSLAFLVAAGDPRSPNPRIADAGWTIQCALPARARRRCRWCCSPASTRARPSRCCSWCPPTRPATT